MNPTNRNVFIAVGFLALAVSPATVSALPPAAQLNRPMESSGTASNLPPSFSHLRTDFLSDFSMKVRCTINVDGRVSGVTVIRRGRDRDVNATLLTELKAQHFAVQIVNGTPSDYEQVLTLQPRQNVITIDPRSRPGA